MKRDPRKYWDNIPQEENKYFGDERDEFKDSSEVTQKEKDESIKEAREYSDND